MTKRYNIGYTFYIADVIFFCHGGGSQGVCECGENRYTDRKVLSEIELLTKRYNIGYTFYIADVIFF